MTQNIPQADSVREYRKRENDHSMSTDLDLTLARAFVIHHIMSLARDKIIEVDAMEESSNDKNEILEATLLDISLGTGKKHDSRRLISVEMDKFSKSCRFRRGGEVVAAGVNVFPLVNVFSGIERFITKKESTNCSSIKYLQSSFESLGYTVCASTSYEPEYGRSIRIYLEWTNSAYESL